MLSKYLVYPLTRSYERIDDRQMCIHIRHNMRVFSCQRLNLAGNLAGEPVRGLIPTEVYVLSSHSIQFWFQNWRRKLYLTEKNYFIFLFNLLRY